MNTADTSILAATGNIIAPSVDRGSTNTTIVASASLAAWTRAAWAAGRRAADEFAPRSACPYTDPTRRQAWECGWKLLPWRSCGLPDGGRHTLAEVEPAPILAVVDAPEERDDVPVAAATGIKTPVADRPRGAHRRRRRAGFDWFVMALFALAIAVLGTGLTRWLVVDYGPAAGRQHMAAAAPFSLHTVSSIGGVLQ